MTNYNNHNPYSQEHECPCWIQASKCESTWASNSARLERRKDMLHIGQEWWDSNTVVWAWSSVARSRGCSITMGVGRVRECTANGELSSWPPLCCCCLLRSSRTRFCCSPSAFLVFSSMLVCSFNSSCMAAIWKNKHRKENRNQTTLKHDPIALLVRISQQNTMNSKAALFSLWFASTDMNDLWVVCRLLWLASFFFTMTYTHNVQYSHNKFFLAAL